MEAGGPGCEVAGGGGGGGMIGREMWGWEEWVGGEPDTGIGSEIDVGGGEGGGRRGREEGEEKAEAEEGIVVELSKGD